MSWAPKRFWAEASVHPEDAGFTVHLDTRPLRTPAKAPLLVPTRAMAEAIAAEWNAQTGLVVPQTMPVTRAANSALDKVIPQRAEVVEILAAYGETDLLCYRATAPSKLVAAQAAAWDPLLDWAARDLGAVLIVGHGVMFHRQPAQSLALLREQVAALPSFELVGFNDLVALSGSLVLGLAILAGHRSAAEAWDLSRIDENWQARQWGHDEEASAAAALKRADFLEAERFLSLCRE